MAGRGKRYTEEQIIATAISDGVNYTQATAAHAI